jgi:hypothetical protein
MVGDAQLLEELRDYFTCMQLEQHQQGESSQPLTEPYNLPGTVPAAALPKLMQAAGYYPSQRVIQDLIAHVQFLKGGTPAASKPVSAVGAVREGFSGKLTAGDQQGGNVALMADTAAAGDGGDNAAGQAVAAGLRGSKASSRAQTAESGGSGAFGRFSGIGPEQHAQEEEEGGVDFETFLYLYVNHRPVQAVTKQDVVKALAVLGADYPGGKQACKDAWLWAYKACFF